MAATEAYQGVKPLEEHPAIEIGGPVALWMLILAIGTVLSLFVSYAGLSHSTFGPTLVLISNLILQLPGVVVLPLLIALWLGARIGSAKKGTAEVVKVGLINAVYVAVIYAMGMIVIYLVTQYLQASPFTNLNTFVVMNIALPLVLLLIITPAIAALSAKRKAIS